MFLVGGWWRWATLPRAGFSPIATAHNMLRTSEVAPKSIDTHHRDVVLYPYPIKHGMPTALENSNWPEKRKRGDAGSFWCCRAPPLSFLLTNVKIIRGILYHFTSKILCHLSMISFSNTSDTSYTLLERTNVSKKNKSFVFWEDCRRCDFFSFCFCVFFLFILVLRSLFYLGSLPLSPSLSSSPCMLFVPLYFWSSHCCFPGFVFAFFFFLFWCWDPCFI